MSIPIRTRMNVMMQKDMGEFVTDPTVIVVGILPWGNPLAGKWTNSSSRYTTRWCETVEVFDNIDSLVDKY